MSLYNSYVRPHLEYCVQAWRPHFIHDINMLEAVQRRATKMIPELRNKSYSERPKALNMFSFEYRLLRGDLIEVFKIFKGIDKVDYSNMFKFGDNIRNRGHFLKLDKPRCNIDIRKYFFSNRVVDEWNSLPVAVIGSTTVDSFKSSLDKHLGSRFQ